MSHAAPDPDELLALADLATELANTAGSFLLRGVDRPRTALSTKSSPTDMVSEMDQGAERLLVEGIRAARPHDGILGEEGTDHTGTSGFRWVIDPLDGTTNYLYRHPFWAVSIGIEWHGRPVVGVVEAPMLRETYVGIDARGATCNGTPIRVSDCNDPSRALVGTGFGYAPERRAWQGAVAASIAPLVRDLRRGGSAAIDLAFVAGGRLDGFYERGLNPWDACGGTVLIREAGGLVSDLSGQSGPTESMCIAAPAAIHHRLRTLVESAIAAANVPEA